MRPCIKQLRDGEIFRAEAKVSQLLEEFPEIPKSLAANACLVSEALRFMWFRRFRSGKNVLFRLTAEQISDCAARACAMYLAARTGASRPEKTPEYSGQIVEMNPNFDFARYRELN